MDHYRPDPGDYENNWDWADQYLECWAIEHKITKQLKDDILQNGMNNPIILGKNGRVLDGKRRICALMHVWPEYKEDVPIEYEC